MLLRSLIQTILFTAVCATFTACNGQQATNTPVPSKETQETTISLGDTVPELGKSIKAIYQETNGRYWFGGEGIYMYDGSQFVFFNQKDGVCGKAVTDIQEDQNGNIYFDTPDGVCKFDGQQFTTLEIVSNEPEKNEWKLAPTDLWFRMGWDSKGPYRYDGKVLHQLTFPKSPQEDAFIAQYPNAVFSPYGIYSIYTDSKGHVWFGTSSLGICRFNGISAEWLYEDHLTNTPVGGSFGIRSIIEDNEGYFWFCNTREKFKILSDNPTTKTPGSVTYTTENGIAHINEKGEEVYPYVLSIAKTKNIDLWMASYDEGVWHYDGNTLTNYSILDGDKQVLLHSIYADNNGALWVGTQNNGVYKFNGTTFEKFHH